MRITFTLKGLECPNCAAKIEDRVQKLDGIAEAKLNFMTQSLVLCPSPECEGTDFLPIITDIVHTFEPDVIIKLHAYSLKHKAQ